MAIQGEGTDSIEQTMPGLTPKDNLKQETSDDSEAGSFLDDDTENFLPCGWTGSAKKKTPSDYKSRKRGAINIKADKVKCPSPALTIVKKLSLHEDHYPTSSLTSLDASVSSISVGDSGSTILASSTAEPSAKSTAAATDWHYHQVQAKYRDYWATSSTSFNDSPSTHTERSPTRANQISQVRS
ncbi:hypothetical protein ONS95_008319 [Cadophora gregata]|uniref:uncharacterized protein n=1 Tax=Cadophora gregata TaxID=51156 RepID=UPI0026DCA1D0|nr:uncharacterized protein ONS95_008319 [Cadophora gregata]KAK0100365.1 hypothetical protein ONS96_007645 [Cadophora gregata f. sp. sojae]KAK0126739.1 hypothetical protein ONS95_008319 [Cadophora gregata]